MHMKRLLFTITIIFFLFVTGAAAQEFTIEGADLFNETVSEISSGNMSLSASGVLKYIWDGFFGELRSVGRLMLSIFATSALSAMLGIVKRDETGEAAFFVCFCISAAATAKIIGITVGYGESVIDEMCDFVTKLAPILCILLAGGGFVSSAQAFYPVFSASVYVICMIMEKFIVPMIYLSAVCGIVNNISGRVSLNNFSKMIKSFSKWILTLSLTIFSGINALYGFCMPGIDGVGLSAAKLAVGSFVPLVGGFLADSIETVISGARLMKNAVGTAGIIALLAICAIPLIKMGAVIFALKISAAIIEPVGDKRFSDMTAEAAEAATTVFAMTAVTAVLFILTIAIILGATNGAVI